MEGRALAANRGPGAHEKQTKRRDETRAGPRTRPRARPDRRRPETKETGKTKTAAAETMCGAARRAEEKDERNISQPAFRPPGDTGAPGDTGGTGIPLGGYYDTPQGRSQVTGQVEHKRSVEREKKYKDILTKKKKVI